MKTQPKQIINNIYYNKFFFTKLKSDQDNLINKFINDYKLICDPLFFGRARMGIYLLIKFAIDDTKKKKVLLSPYTIPDVINLVILAGGEPYFIDSNIASTNLNLNIINDNVKGAACILITHYHIMQNEIIDIKKICTENQVYLFEDCAISLGGKYDSTYAGNIGDAGIFSLSGYKQLNFFWGGAVITSNKKIHNYIKLISQNFKNLNKIDYIKQIYKISRYDIATRNIIFQFITFPYIKYRVKNNDDIYQLKIPRLETEAIDISLESKPHDMAFSEWNEKYENISIDNNHRKKISNIYNNFFIDNLVATESNYNVKHGSCYINYPIIVKNRNSKYKEIIKANIDVGLSIYPNCAQYDKFKNIKGCTDNFKFLEDNVIFLPTHNRITPDYADHISCKLKNIL